MTVYIDVLLAVNLYINYFLIRGTAVLLCRDISVSRNLAAAAVGTLFSLTILLPQLPFWLTAVSKTAGGIVIAAAAFGLCKKSDFIINILCFLVISFLYAGLMLALWLFVAPNIMFYRNGSAYFDIPIIAVAVITAVGYIAIRFVRYLSDKRCIGARSCDILLSSAGHTVTLKAVPDTGNALCDPFSGKPVIICSRDSVQLLMPACISDYLSGRTEDLEGIRLAPCMTLGGNVLLPIFNADKIYVDGKPVDAVIGVSRHELGAECIFNPKLL